MRTQTISLRFFPHTSKLLFSLSHNETGTNISTRRRRHFEHTFFKEYACILKEKFCILIQIAPNYVPEGTIDNQPSVVPVISLRQAGKKPVP